ncbi:ABC transporter permease [Marinisporobacter balticus]|uniref:ABC-2 type transport system permease protein n=1 Tax=Marinisporobacter balticus TaxID=2018667 RepID=A0A4R2KGW7_9FIRM|nr:ABC transporter permease [Marinisporobacter balticus]TCO69699.1 ABC-2 type transport system permease protein [Marinisporobacter balticus]
MNFGRLITIVKKEFIHIIRDKASLGMAIMMPILFIFLFGYAVNTDVDHIKMAVMDMDHTIQSRELISKFKTSNYFEPTIYVQNIEELESLIDKGEVRGGIIIPSGFLKQIKKGKSAQIQFIIDGTDPTIAKTALQSGMMLTQKYSLEINNKHLEKNGLNNKSNSTIDIRTRVWYNPNLESTKFTIPGLIGLILQNVTVMLTAFSLVREKEMGTLELLIVTPIKSVELILGKMIPYIFIGAIDFLIALFFGTYWFNVSIEGSILLLMILGFGFVICSLAIGMFISTVAQNQAQAMQMTLFFILPSVLLSGFVFPIEAMPKVIQIGGNFIPLTYFLKILRGIILKGVGIHYLWKEVMVLSIVGILLLVVASVRFNKKLD